MPEVPEPLPWQGSQWQHLGSQLAAQRLPHALLLAGPPGVGKARFARALSALLLCHSPLEGLACGECSACRLVAGGSHGDLRWLEPEDKSRVIKIDQVREMLEFAGKTAGFGQRKVVVLAPAESLNTNAANALLKCLEEPTAGTHILLVCNRLHGLPATIRSRCQMLRFPQPGEGECLGWLAEVIGEHDKAPGLLAEAAGAPLEAERLFREEGVLRPAALIAAVDRVRAGSAAVPELASLLSQYALEESLEFVQHYLQRWLAGCPRERLTSGAGRAAFDLLDELQQLRGAIAGGANPNPQLTMDTLACRLEALGAP